MPGITKGKHLHWILKNPLQTSNENSVNVYKQIVTGIIKIFDGDTHATVQAAGRVWRNPIMHHTITPRKSTVQFKDFYSMLKKVVPHVSKGYSKAFSRSLEGVKEGSRNVSLFDFTRAYAYRNRTISFNDLFEVAEFANNEMANPLPKGEVESIVKSVLKFTKNRLKSGHSAKTDSSVIEYNRELARNRSEKAQKSILNSFLSLPLTPLKNLLKMPLRELSRILNVPYSTLRKYINEIKEIALKFLKKDPENFYYIIYNLFAIETEKNPTVIRKGDIVPTLTLRSPP